MSCQSCTPSQNGFKTKKSAPSLGPVWFRRAHFCDQEKVCLGKIECGLFEKNDLKGHLKQYFMKISKITYFNQYFSMILLLKFKDLPMGIENGPSIPLFIDFT